MVLDKLLNDFFQKTAMRLHECDIRHLEESGKRRAEANTWEPVGFPVDGKNVLKKCDKENFSNHARVKWQIKASECSLYLWTFWRGGKSIIILRCCTFQERAKKSYYEILTLQDSLKHLQYTCLDQTRM